MRNLKVETRLNMMVGVMSVFEIIIIIIMIIKLWKSSHIAKETWIQKSKMMKKNAEIASQIGMNLKFRG
jgi:DNA gyrase/topoisomerase IV subunit A